MTKRLLVCVGASLMILSSLEAATLYVAPTGDDANPGTLDQPLATLEAARDAARQLSTEGETRILLREGRYPRTNTLELDERDSGVVFSAYPDETAVLDGGVVIDPSDVQPVTDPAILQRIVVAEARPHIRQVDLKPYGVPLDFEFGPRGFRRAYRAAPPELFIDAEAQQIARWPNKGESFIPLGKVVDTGSVYIEGEFDLRPAIFNYETPRADQWTQADQLYISGLFAREWADDTLAIAHIDTEAGTFTTAQPHVYGLTQRPFTSWYAINLLEEIDQPGEYFIDRTSGLLYFYPPHDLEHALIQVSTLDEVMIAIEGASHVRIERLTLENSRATGIYIERGESNTIAGCTLRNFGELGIQIGQGTEAIPEGLHNAHGILAEGIQDPAPASRILGNWHEHVYKYPAFRSNAGFGHSIISCDIYHMGAGGIHLDGGDRKTLTPSRHQVVNCDIYDVNRLDRTYKACINLNGVGQRIAHNHLHNAQGQAIYLHGNNHLIEYNEIDHVLLDISDMGAIYMGRDPSESGHVIRYNFFHHIFDKHHGAGAGVQAIFLDDGTLYASQIYGNVFYQAGSKGVIKHHMGGGDSIANNVAIDCPPLQIAARKSNTARAIRYIRIPPEQRPKDNPQGGVQYLRVHVADSNDLRGVNIDQEPYRSAYPYLYESWITGEDFTPPLWNNVETTNLALFVDAEHLNFAFKQGAVPSLVATGITDRVAGVVEQDIPFQPIPFDQIGLYSDGLR